MHVRLSSSSTLRFRCAAPPALLSQQQPFITGRHYTTRSLLSFHHPSSLSLSLSSSSSHSSLLLQQQQQQRQREEQQEQIERYRDENENENEKVEEKTPSSENHDAHSDEMRTKSNVKNDKHFLQPDQHPSLISSLRSAFSRQEYDDDTMTGQTPLSPVQSKLKRDHPARAQNQPDGVLRRSARSVTHVFAYFSQNYYLIAFSFLLFLMFYILDPVSLRNERRNLSARAKREEREMWQGFSWIKKCHLHSFTTVWLLLMFLFLWLLTADYSAAS